MDIRGNFGGGIDMTLNNMWEYRCYCFFNVIRWPDFKLVSFTYKFPFSLPFGVDLLLFISVEVSDVTAFTIFLVIGILYDAYYFHVIGIATLLLPLLSVLVNKYNTIMMGTNH